MEMTFRVDENGVMIPTFMKKEKESIDDFIN